MKQWIRNAIHTSRGEFEVFVKGEGEPLCVTHLYSEFNESNHYPFLEEKELFKEAINNYFLKSFHPKLE